MCAQAGRCTEHTGKQPGRTLPGGPFVSSHLSELFLLPALSLPLDCQHLVKTTFIIRQLITNWFIHTGLTSVHVTQSKGLVEGCFYFKVSSGLLSIFNFYFRNTHEYYLRQRSWNCRRKPPSMLLDCLVSEAASLRSSALLRVFPLSSFHCLIF